ncbi:hypothetical protein Ocin01_19851 [Orchesella cincta]|uniref:Uncharacterized protein n=1 Tax=Orchesella cincta TaxID=48709 RepID=A0A1D2M1N2_ORCCI|nr:hypothetical protein Ocin01_19851 [Orchesella cincta]
MSFAQNYLEISSSVAMQQLLKTRSETDAFCEKCELAVINPICKVYLELLSAQLRLSWELERLGKLLENSQSDQQEGDTNLEILVGQLGIENVEQFEEFRKLLAKKCELKRNEAIPNVLLMSRCDEGRIVPSFWDYDEDLDHSLHDPFDTQSLSENRDDDEVETKPEIVIVIKTEPETLQNFENRNTELDTDADSPTASNSVRLPQTSPTNGEVSWRKLTILPGNA